MTQESVESVGGLPPLLQERTLNALEYGLAGMLAQAHADSSELREALTQTLVPILEGSDCAEGARLLRERMDFVSAPMPAHLRVVDDALGCAAGRLCGRCPTELQWRLARAILGVLPHSAAGFEAAVWAALHPRPKASHELLATLQARASNFATHPGDLVDVWAGDASYFSNPATHPQNGAQWSSPSRVPMFIIRDAIAFDLLRRLDVALHLQLLASLPHREFARQILEDASRRADTAGWCDLLRALPSHSASDSPLRPAGSLVTMSLAACLNRWFIPDADQAARSHALIDSDAVDLEIQQVLATVRTRNDWQVLGYAWLQQVIACARKAEAKPDTARSERWFSLIRSLATTLNPRADSLEWVREERDARRNDRIYSVLMVILSQTPMDSNSVSRWMEQVLTNALVSSQQIERMAVNAQFCDRQFIALAMRSVGPSAQGFNSLWAKIFFLRDRARRLSYRAGSDIPPNVALVAAFWGLIGLGELALNSPSAQALWAALEVAIRESRLTEASHSSAEAWCIAVLYLAAHWTHVFPDDPSAGHPGSLDDFLSNWAGPVADFAYLAAELSSNGVRASQFKRSMPSGDLLRAALADAQRARGAQGPFASTAQIEKLAADIDTMTA